MNVLCYRDLIAWQKAMDYVVEVYGLTDSFPRAEQFGLTSQLRRAAVSIPSNIAEGHGRDTTPDFLRFLSNAYGSINETQTQLMLGQRLNFVPGDVVKPVMERSFEVARLVNGLRLALQKKLGGNS